MATRLRHKTPKQFVAAGSIIVQSAVLPTSFTGYYFQRNQHLAPSLDDRLDKRAQAIFSGLDTRRSYLPAEQRSVCGKVPPQELDDVVNALEDHSVRAFELIRSKLDLASVEWLSLANGAEQAFIQNGGVVGKPDFKGASDKRGYVRHIPLTDIGVVGSKQPGDRPITLAMYVADCLAIPIVDRRTQAFALVHAGRPGTGLRVAEKAVKALVAKCGSCPADLSAYLGEGVCLFCYQIDEATYDGFAQAFGGEAAIDDVIRHYPSAILRLATGSERHIGIDLYAFNAYLLEQQGVGEVIIARNCPARLSPQCISWQGSIPETEQQFYSHTRGKNKMIGWRMANGQMIDLNTQYIGTPRNLVTITRR